MDINISKCETIHFGKNNPQTIYSINHVPVPRGDKFRDLGLIVDNDLSFRFHTDHITHKSYKLLGLCIHVFHSKRPELYLVFYKTFVIPILDHCDIFYVFALKSSLSVVEHIKEKFTKRLFRRLHPHHCPPPYDLRLREFNLTTLFSRFKYSDLITLFKVHYGFIDSPSFKVRFSTLRRHRILIPSIRTALYKNSFLHRSLKLWNDRLKSLPRSLSELKSQIHLIL